MIPGPTGTAARGGGGGIGDADTGAADPQVPENGCS
jgi:hypothetical protein